MKPTPTILALLPAVIIIAVMWMPPSADPGSGLHILDPNDPETSRRGLPLRPLSSSDGSVGIALDGGELPFFGQQVPRISLGAPGSKEPLRIAFLSDWTSPECLALHRTLSAVAPSLPPTEVFLLPVFSGQEGEEIHRTLLAIHAASGLPDTLSTLISEIIHGKLKADPAAIRARAIEVEPDLIPRIDPAPEWIVEHADTAFALARAQLARNVALFRVNSFPQLTASGSLLTGAASADELAAFLREAARRQDEWLKTHSAVLLPGSIMRCECQDPAHRHALPFAREFQLQASSFGPPPDQEPPAENDFRADQPADVVGGAQIRFIEPALKAEPIHSGEPTSFTFRFENTGDEPLVIGQIRTSCTCITIHHEPAPVPPGGSSQFIAIFDSAARPDLGAGDHAELIWVATNSVHLTDREYGHQVEMVIPLLGRE